MPGEVTIDFGIDLGTTNSAIALFRDDMSQIIKCQATQSDVTPSVVSYAGNRHWIGAAAKQRLADHPASTFYEFKRSIGTTVTFPLPDGGRVGPEELSAAVLRSLRQDAFDFTGIDVTAAVVTVPAAFDTAQIAATRNAGTLAGFEHVEALQEPIAAALAYGFDQAGDGLFLVFDLGGGTFDAALLRCSGGVFSVINHRGDNDLGGGKWDTALVDQVILPKLNALGFDVSSARDRSSRVFHLLKDRAEAVRIELSRKEATTVELDGISDDTGKVLPDDLTVLQSEFEPLIASNLESCVNACKDLLKEAGVPASAVAKVILVGGPTRTPALRRAVQELGIEPATMVDPMTVVARGAAVYAASRTRPVAVASAPREVAVFQLHYDAMVEREKDEAIVGLKLERAPVSTEVAAVRVIAQDGSWDSGLVGLEEGSAIVAVKLIADGASGYRVSASAPDGSPIGVTPEAFTVTRAVSAAAAPVNHSIGLGVDDSSAGQAFDRLVKRGATMPIFERKSYRTTRTVTPREPDADPIFLLFLEGESDVPERNLKVGEIVIRSDSITRPLPANSEVEVILRWEQGQDPKASAYIPFLDQQFDSVLTMQNKQLPDIGALEAQVVAIRETIGDGASDSDRRGQRLREIEKNLKDARGGDAAAAHHAAAEIGPLLDAIEAESSSELVHISVLQLDAAEEWSRGIVEKFGTNEDQRTLETLVREARGAASSENHRDIDYRRDRIIVHTWRVIMAQPGFWVEEFANLSENAAKCTDPVKAGALIQRGRVALDRQSIEDLTEVVRALWQLFPTSANAMQSYGIRAVAQ